MNGSSANITYASRKRRKPVQKTIKPIPPEGIKSNPSKRHRDRLNTELDRLASLLPFPQDVINKLDKLSVLRLSVSYLRAKSFFDVALKSSRAGRSGVQDNGGTKFGDGLNFHEGEFLLQALNGFVLVVTTDAVVFYASSTIQDYLGFQQSDVIHQSVYELIHTEDRAEFQRQLHWALNPSQCTDSAQRVDEAGGLPQLAGCPRPEQLPPENSAFMERSFACRLRCLLDNSSGFLAMNFQGRLKYLHGQNRKAKDGSVLPPQLALFAIATPLQPPSILEIRTKNFIFRTKHKLDFTPTGVDAKGKLILGYTEAELCMRGSGYQFIHAADMLYCAEYHIRMIKTGESGLVVFRLLTKDNQWTWVQSNARLVYKNGRPDYIIATQRPLTDEEGTEHLRKRNLKLPFMFATGEAVLYEITNPFPPVMDPLPVRPKHVAGGNDCVTESAPPKDSLWTALSQQDKSVYLSHAASSVPLDGDILHDYLDQCIGWQDSVAPVGNDRLKHELGQPQEGSMALPGGPAGLFPDSRNSDLHSIMKHLGIDFEDIRHMQQNEEFFGTDFSGEHDFQDIDIADEILTFVQDSLDKSSFVCPGYQQPAPPAPGSGCAVQECLQWQQQQQQPHPQQPHPQRPAAEPQQQLCQKMKHMQVNGMFADWSASQPVPFSCPQQEQQQYGVFPDLPGTSQELPYKSEMEPVPYAHGFLPCNQSASPRPGTQLDLPVGGFEPSPYPATASNLEGFVTCLQVSENQRHGLHPQAGLVTPQTCYSGAVSMYPCQPEPQQRCVAQMQYSAAAPGPQAFLTQFQNGALNDIYPAELSAANDSQTAAHLQSLHHLSEARPFTDLTSSRFL